MFERMNLKIVNSSSDFKVMFLSYQTIFFCALKNNMRRVSTSPYLNAPWPWHSLANFFTGVQFKFKMNCPSRREVGLELTRLSCCLDAGLLSVLHIRFWKEANLQGLQSGSCAPSLRPRESSQSRDMDKRRREGQSGGSGREGRSPR